MDWRGGAVGVYHLVDLERIVSSFLGVWRIMRQEEEGEIRRDISCADEARSCN